jgi:hypothetical protein
MLLRSESRVDRAVWFDKKYKPSLRSIEEHPPRLNRAEKRIKNLPF